MFAMFARAYEAGSRTLEHSVFRQCSRSCWRIPAAAYRIFRPSALSLRGRKSENGRYVETVAGPAPEQALSPAIVGSGDIPTDRSASKI
jgi:hypothetical protein